tara:strand:- start:1178 stop:3616 length:2439 start_codon:yes stop_codon:yes gene_type:complete
MINYADEMRVIKRDGNHEEIAFDKILNRVKTCGKKDDLKINYSQLCLKVIDQLFDGIKTTQIDELAAEQCASLSTSHPEYSKLASNIIISNHHKNTKATFFEAMSMLYNFQDIHKNNSQLISNDLYTIVNNNKERIENEIDYDKDYLFDYFGFKTLERAYLMRVNGNIVERPQHMWMRVSIGIHGNDLDKAFETYHLMSSLMFTHATPTLFNAGTPRPQLSSCYLLSLENDSITGIYDTLKDCASISKWAGGIGLHIHNLRAKGSHIRGTNGTSNGVVPMLRVFNNTARYVDQGGGKRNGSFAIYMEPWHSDIIEFLDLRKNHGDEELRARDLFYALWIPDLFMEKVKSDSDWCLFCPDKCPGLSDCYGDEFKALYEKYESEERYNVKMSARKLWFAVMDSQMETGTPYLLYKDAANIKSNQKNIGTIKSSNLCTEIIEYSDNTETAVCNLASIALSKFVKADKTFDYDRLCQISQIVTYNLNKIIDVNFYPTPKTKKSNIRHRPIGIGVQGLADAFALMDIAFHSDQAKEINKLIFETIYYGALKMSNKISKERSELLSTMGGRRYDSDGLLSYVNEYEIDMIDNGKSFCGAYSTFEDSPASNGILQFDMWGVTPSDRYNWDELKSDIKTYGLRNSLLLAPMPTASTSQILGNNECFEPFTSNIYTRRTLAGEFVIVNKYLISDLLKENMWNEDIKNNIIANKGSIQYIEGIGEHLKEKYKIVWEIPMKHLIDMAADRGAFICQSQSLNLWLEDPSYNNLTSMHFYSWSQGLKTGIYYLRRKPKHQPQQFTIAPSNQKVEPNNEPCEMCSA